MIISEPLDATHAESMRVTEMLRSAFARLSEQTALWQPTECPPKPETRRETNARLKADYALRECGRIQAASAPEADTV
jgi:hypothetical protein